MKNTRATNFLADQFQRNVIYSWASQIINLTIVFFLTPIIVAELGDYRYGLWLLVNSIVAYMSLLELGVNISTGRFVNISIGEKDYVRASEILSTSTVFYLLLPCVFLPLVWVFGDELVVLFLDEDMMRNEVFYAVLMTVAALFINLSAANTRIRLTSKHKFDVISLISLLEVILRGGLVLFFLEANENPSLMHISLATLVSAVFSWGLSGVLSKLYGENISFKLDRVSSPVFLTIFTFSAWVLLSNLGVASINYADKIIISYFANSKYVAYYGIGFMLFTHMSTMLSKLNQVKIPQITQLVGRSDEEGMLAELQYLIYLTGVVSIPAVMTFIVLAEPFVTLWLGENYLSSAVVAQVLALSLIFSLSMGGIGASLWAKGIVRTLSILKIIVAVCNVGLSIVLIHVMENQILGVAIATVAVRLAELNVVMPILARKELNLSIKSIIRSNFLFLLFGLVLYFGVSYVDFSSIDNWYMLVLYSVSCFVLMVLFSYVFVKLAKPEQIRLIR